jgi:hypothetical protein
VILEGGLLAALLLVAAVGWWLWKSIGVWRQPVQPGKMLQLAGSGMLLLVLVASIWDYPARTPLIMALTVLAAIWLATPPPQHTPRNARASAHDLAVAASGGPSAEEARIHQ